MSKPTKLTLKRETIRNLGDDDMGAVNGGTSPAVPAVTLASARFCIPVAVWTVNQGQQGFPAFQNGAKAVKAVGGGLVAGAKAIPGNIRDGLIGLATPHG